MDMLAYMLGKQAGGGGGGGGNSDFYPILPGMLMNALWESPIAWEDGHSVDFTMDWTGIIEGMSGEQTTYYGAPGKEITLAVVAPDNVGGLLVCTYEEYINPSGTPIIYEDRTVNYGETFTFTMPNTAVVFDTW